MKGLTFCFPSKQVVFTKLFSNSLCATRIVFASSRAGLLSYLIQRNKNIPCIFY